MDRDFLFEYVQTELESGRRLVKKIKKTKSSSKTNLRQLYGLSSDAKIVYAESGGLKNIDCFPNDTTLIIPIFPWSVNDLEKAVGSFNKLRGYIDSGRVVPIIQHPLYYAECDHLQFLFDKQTPSYFIRGLFAYSAILGIEPKVEINETGIPVLSNINQLMNHCNDVHLNWLQHCKSDDFCWEYRYRRQSVRDDKFFRRLHSSLCYRYASVALCIGQHNADEIISIFPTKKSSAILLHLHIMFDHIMCHGLGSDFVVRPNTSDGKDFISSKRVCVTKAHELKVGNELIISLPDEDSEYVRGLLREEHFLRQIDFSLISPETLPDLQSQLNRQFSNFRKKISNISKGKKITNWSVQISIYLLSATAIAFGSSSQQFGGAAALVGGLKVPWLTDIVSNTMEKIYRNKLASYTINRPLIK